MKPLLRDVLLFACVQIVLLVALIWTCYDVRDVSPLSPATVIKHERLTTAGSPRLILVGGSNLLFGIDSSMIEQQTPFHPVNMGLIGGLRLEYILSEIEPSLRPGDWVVFSIEYNTLNADENTDETQVVLAVAMQRPANLRFLNAAQWKRVLDRGAFEYLGILFRQCVGAIGHFGGSEDDQEPLITRDMNEFGDFTRYHDPKVTPRRENNQNTLIKFKPEAVAANIVRVNDFIARCKSRDVHVVFAYPPIPRTHIDRNEAIARRFHRQLREQLDAQVLLSPEDAVYPDRNFIGLSYHLRGDAVRQRTQTLIDAINRRIRRAADRSVPATAPADAGEAN